MTSLGLCLVGTLFLCIGNMVSADCQKRGITLFASTSWGMFYGACYLALFSLISHHEFIVEPTAKYLLGLFWLALVSSVMTFAAYLSLIGRIGVSRAGYATVIFPVFALLISTMLSPTHGRLHFWFGAGHLWQCDYGACPLLACWLKQAGQMRLPKVIWSRQLSKYAAFAYTMRGLVPVNWPVGDRPCQGKRNSKCQRLILMSSRTITKCGYDGPNIPMGDPSSRIAGPNGQRQQSRITAP